MRWRYHEIRRYLHLRYTTDLRTNEQLQNALYMYVFVFCNSTANIMQPVCTGQPISSKVMSIRRALPSP